MYDLAWAKNKKFGVRSESLRAKIVDKELFSCVKIIKFLVISYTHEPMSSRYIAAILSRFFFSFKSCFWISCFEKCLQKWFSSVFIDEYCCIIYYI